MSVSSAVQTNIKPPIWKVFLDNLIRLPWTWRITIGYLTFMLFIPIVAMFLKASTEPPAKFW